MPFVPDLVERKLTGKEKSLMTRAEVAFHEREYERLLARLEEASRESRLPEEPSAESALNDLLVQLRLGQRA